MFEKLILAFVLAAQTAGLDDLVVTGKAEEARAAIARGADVNERDKDGVTLLMRAASAGRGDMVRLLIAGGADVRAIASGGVDALMMASLGGYADAVAPLVAAKADVNAKDRRGRTALMAAASSGSPETVEALLAAGADATLTDSDGDNALTYAAGEGSAATVEMLQRRGAKPGAKDLLLAVRRCKTPIVDLFLAAGASPNAVGDGAPPLLIAAANNCIEAVEVLIARGANINATGREGQTPLIAATAAGHTDVVRALVAKGADLDLEDALGRTAPLYSTQRDREAIAEIFRTARASSGPAPVTVTSAALKHNEPMPREFTADGRNISPPLAWSQLPEQTKSVAVVCEDPDAGNPPPFVHWVIYNIPPAATGLPENIPFTPGAPMPPEITGAVQGISGFRRPIYRGPAPPPGKPHHYHFIVYALDIAELPAGLNRAGLLEAIEGHVVGRGELISIYERKP